MKCDGTRTETRFRLSTKRTCPFKSAGTSVQSTTGSRGVRIIGCNAGYTKFRSSVKGDWLPTPFASFHFTSPPVRHCVPSCFKRSLPMFQKTPAHHLPVYKHYQLTNRIGSDHLAKKTIKQKTIKEKIWRKSQIKKLNN